MAYDTNVDYKALQEQLKKQKAATTDVAQQAAIQAQIDAAEQSRMEKIASNMNTYGKYATAAELDSAAGIAAQNQIGTGYETQKANLNKSYDNARTNANNDALSRGMARSSFVGDRLANLDVERGNALADVDASKALAIQNAKANILSNYQAGVANAATQTYNQNLDRANTLAQYGDVSGYKDVGYTDAQIAAMQKYLADQAAAKAAKSYSGGGPSPKPATMTYSQLNAAVAQIQASQSDEAAYNFIMQNAGEYADQLLAIYNLSAPAPKVQRTANYGSQTIQDVNDRINAGYTPQEVMAAAKEKYGVGSKEYNDIVSAVLRQR